MSDRVRHGYRPTPFWSKLLMRYNLLCDKCNWEFVGFALPGTISHKPTKKNKPKQAENTVGVDAGKVSEKDNSQIFKTASASKE